MNNDNEGYIVRWELRKSFLFNAVYCLSLNANLLVHTYLLLIFILFLKYYYLGQTFDNIEASLERDKFMNPQQAVEFGLIGEYH